MTRDEIVALICDYLDVATGTGAKNDAQHDRDVAGMLRGEVEISQDLSRVAAVVDALISRGLLTVCVLLVVLLGGLACRDRTTVEGPRRAEEKPAERPVEVPAPPPVAPPPSVVRPIPMAPIVPPGPATSKPEPARAPVDDQCYVLRVSGGVPRVTGSMACPAGR